MHVTGCYALSLDNEVIGNMFYLYMKGLEHTFSSKVQRQNIIGLPVHSGCLHRRQGNEAQEDCCLVNVCAKAQNTFSFLFLSHWKNPK